MLGLDHVISVMSAPRPRRRQSASVRSEARLFGVVVVCACVAVAVATSPGLAMRGNLYIGTRTMEPAPLQTAIGWIGRAKCVLARSPPPPPRAATAGTTAAAVATLATQRGDANRPRAQGPAIRRIRR